MARRKHNSNIDKKGEKNKPENYRPITLLSCMGKLFASILNERLNALIDEFDILHENQTGFRKKITLLLIIYFRLIYYLNF
jgi:23S rRNA maturation mini-RNase III